MPLGDHTKEEVRDYARRLGLPVADKAGSQEVCFIPDNDYRGFILSRFKDRIKEGDIVDKQGNILPYNTSKSMRNQLAACDMHFSVKILNKLDFFS